MLCYTWYPYLLKHNKDHFQRDQGHKHRTFNSEGRIFSSSDLVFCYFSGDKLWPEGAQVYT